MWGCREVWTPWPSPPAPLRQSCPGTHCRCKCVRGGYKWGRGGGGKCGGLDPARQHCHCRTAGVWGGRGGSVDVVVRDWGLGLGARELVGRGVTRV